MADPIPPTPVFIQKGRPSGNARRSEIRRCRIHGDVEFNVFGSERGRERWRCKRCVGEAVTRRHQKVKQILVEEAGGRCAWCGYSRCKAGLHFHHVDPSTKSFPLNMSYGKGIEKMRAEARKCVLLCALCHTEVEARLKASPPLGATYANKASWWRPPPPPPWPHMGW
jgi:hypothetical protein